MANNKRCKIDTSVFEVVKDIMLHITQSIGNVQRHINLYLKEATKDFNHQLEAIKQRLVEAKEEEARRKEEKEKAKIAWDDAITAREDAQKDKDEAQDKTNEAYNDKQDAWEAMDDARKEWEEAKEAQQDAYQDMKDHNISHDEFEEYIEDTQEKKEKFFEKKDIFTSKKESFIQAKKNLDDAIAALKKAQQQEKEAKEAYFRAKDLYEEAIEERKRREVNFKEAKEIVNTFIFYKKVEYYHPYFKIGEENPGCNSVLTFMRTSMRREFGCALEEIKEAVNGILRCSLKEGVSYDERYLIPSPRPQKPKITRNQIKEEMEINKRKLDKELERPEDEPLNYTERCKGCGRLISLCICPDKEAPTSLTE